jgi:hypothetical protein
VKRLAAVLLLCIPAIPVVAVAAETEAPTADAQHDAAAKPEKPKKVCRTETKTGSVMPKRVCRTPEQIKAEQDAAQDQLDRNQRGA